MNPQYVTLTLQLHYGIEGVIVSRENGVVRVNDHHAPWHCEWDDFFKTFEKLLPEDMEIDDSGGYNWFCDQFRISGAYVPKRNEILRKVFNMELPLELEFGDLCDHYGLPRDEENLDEDFLLRISRYDGKWTVGGVYEDCGLIDELWAPASDEIAIELYEKLIEDL